MSFDRSAVGRSRWPLRPAWTLVKSREEFGGNTPLLSLSAQLGIRLRPESEGRAASEDTSGYRVVREGDLVINRLSARDGAYGVARLEGLVSPAYWVLTPDMAHLDDRWLDYVLRSAHYKAELRRISKFMPPAQFDLPWDRFRSLPVPTPTLYEQRAIADFLDTETARIDALIAKRTAMSLLSAERWKSELTDRLFGSWAAEFLGDGRQDAPTDWTIRSLVDLTDRSVPIVYGILLPGPRLDEGVPYLGAGDVAAERLTPADLPRTPLEVAAAYPRSFVREGELIYAIRGTVGAVLQVSRELDGVNLSRDAARIRPSGAVNGRWLLHALKSELAQEQFRRKTIGATITGVNIEDLKRVRLLVPPKATQSRLATEIDAAWTKHQSLDRRLDRQIALLRERRQALITAAVTGELEIPGAAA